MRFTFRSRSVGVRHARVTAQRDDVNTTERLAPIFVRSAPQTNLLIPPTHKAQAEGKKPLYVAGLSVTLGAMSVTLGAIVTATRAAKQAWHGGYAHTALSPSLTSPVPS